MKDLIGLLAVILLIAIVARTIVQCEGTPQKTNEVSDSTSVCCQDSLLITDQNLEN